MKYDIEVLKRKMLVKYPFFGSVVANVNYQENQEVQTAGTDGKIIYFNPGFLENLSVNQQIFVLAHEVCHIAFNHIFRSKGKDLQIWNIATDAIINAFLKKDGLAIVDGVVDIPEAINYNAEQLYEKLLKESESLPQEQDNSEKQEKQNKTNEETGHDSHSMWDDASKKYEEEQNNSEKQEERTNVEKKQKECESLGEIDAFKINKEEREKALEELKEMITKQAMQSNITTNTNIRDVSETGRTRPLIDWRYILRETINCDVDWSYKKACIEDGVISANLEEQPMAETEILLDTSYSINSILLKNFLRECKNILKYSRLKVGCFDTKFYGFQEIRTENDIENMNFLGGGGTSFETAINAFSRRVDNKIIFTDGEADMPEKSINLVWIVFGETKIEPNGGKVIYISEEQLKRLSSFENNGLTRSRTR